VPKPAVVAAIDQYYRRNQTSFGVCALQAFPWCTMRRALHPSGASALGSLRLAGLALQQSVVSAASSRNVAEQQ
jgi:hypothetical protein